ncbi:hypothetical protein KR009_005681 [Drosophila setifemur]|nr:hypothetical protein KR009_005681 [Drosophila setifemur]
MANNSCVKKLVQVSEEAAPAVHMPVIVGNELFVLTQQDIRRVEDIRVLNYSRLAPNGQLFSAGTTNLFDSGSMPISLPHPPNFCTLQDMIAHCSPKKVRTHIDEELDEDCKRPVVHGTSNSANDTPASQHQTPCRNTKTMASMATQLGWSKLNKPCAMFPPRTTNASTSTCGLMTSNTANTAHFARSVIPAVRPCPDRQPIPILAPTPFIRIESRTQVARPRIQQPAPPVTLHATT